MSQCRSVFYRSILLVVITMAIAEVKRILKLHADEIKKKPTVMRFQPPVYNIPKASFMVP